MRAWTEEKQKLLRDANADRAQLIEENQKLRKQLGDSGSLDVKTFEERLELQNTYASTGTR